MTLRPRIATAMVLAAGLGTRMRPLDPSLPKPLVRLAGRAMIDHVLDRLVEAEFGDVVVNVHHKADLIEAHLAGRQRPRVRISDERAQLLDTGGGVRRAHRDGLLGSGPFLAHNSDSVWIERSVSNIARLVDAWRDEARAATCLMLLAKRSTSLGYTGPGDFNLDGEGRVTRPPKGTEVPYVFAGVSIMAPELFVGTPDGPFSLNRVWDAAMAEGRVRGIVLEGIWMHVGDPAAHAAAERLLAGGAA